MTQNIVTENDRLETLERQYEAAVCEAMDHRHLAEEWSKRPDLLQQLVNAEEALAVGRRSICDSAWSRSATATSRSARAAATSACSVSMSAGS
jgi:hypothetical protein